MIPRLVVITDWSIDGMLEKLEAALGAGVPIAVQHRHPEATTRAYFEEAVRVKALCDRFGAPLFVSARVDVALALGTHLHLPAWGLKVADVRSALPGRWISAAVHDEHEADDARGADLAIVSPVFETASKPGAKGIGVEGFERLAAGMRCPAYALGGVTAARASEFPGVAVIAGVLRATDAAEAVRRFLSASV